MPKSVYFVAGEASGDAHGAALMNALREVDPELRFDGRGGPCMREIAGGEFLDWSESSSVLGLWEVLKQYGYFRRQFHATIEQVRAANPDAVILIDYPGFNLRLARALRRRLPRLKIIFYISPQVWAWNRRRIPQMARYLDLMLCIFPFEAELYNQSGLRTVFVGHPMIESLSARRIDAARDANLVALLPGSRMREVAKIFPIMMLAAEEIRAARPQTHFEVAAASPVLAQRITTMLEPCRVPPNSVRVTIGESSAAMQRAQAGIVASGTATLEAALFRLPIVLVYRVALLTYVAARAMVKVKHLGMPNVLAGREIVPEFIQHEAKPDRIASAVLDLLNNPNSRERMVRDFDAAVATLGETPASATAARAVLDELAR